MLELTVNDQGKEIALQFEHSLLALSKWEAKSKRPFMVARQKTNAEMLDYYQCMLTSPEHDPNLVFRLKPSQMDELLEYIQDPMSAATAPPDDGTQKRRHEDMTSDTIYMQMVLLRIPFETQEWHVNRLMMLIAKTAHAQQPEKKEPKGNLLSRWQEINQRNREHFKSKG